MLEGILNKQQTRVYALIRSWHLGPNRYGHFEDVSTRLQFAHSGLIPKPSLDT